MDLIRSFFLHKSDIWLKEADFQNQNTWVMIHFVNELVGYLRLKIMHHTRSGDSCYLSVSPAFFFFLFCEWELSDVNCVFSLGNFQWCICKYTDGPCLDFSGGMFTVLSLGFWDDAPGMSSSSLSIWGNHVWTNTVKHAAVCLGAVCTVVCLPPHAVSQKMSVLL